MKDQYGAEAGKRVFYASEQKGTIGGVHQGSKRRRARRKGRR